jgi:thiol-disulfide isomerase/thioredoxin
LATPRLVADLSSARAVCYQSLPSFRRLDDAALEQQGDGRYRAVIKGQDFPAMCGFYGVTRSPCVEVEPRGPDCIQGTQADGYELQRAFGIGRYSAVVTPVKGQGYVFLDLSALPRSDGPGQVTFSAAAGTSRRLTAIWQAMLARDLRDRSGTSPAPSHANIVAALAAARAERNAVVRQALWANYLSLATAHMLRTAPARTDADRAGVAGALRALTPVSPFWPLVRTHLFDAVQAAGLPLTPDGYAGDVVRSLRTPSERPIAIDAFARVAHRQKDTVALNAWLSWLLRDYEGHNLARAARERYGLNDKVRVGKPFPEFAVQSLDDPSVTLMAKTIGARFLLVDFWATWCIPCIAEIPGLQKAYDRFSGQGFRILSYSLDEDADVVRQFRRDRFPMPWLHGIFRQGFDGLSEDFGLFGIPAPLLLDAEGRVVAMRGDLMGGKLEKLLERLIR